jgi:hypothetical protein
MASGDQRAAAVFLAVAAGAFAAGCDRGDSSSSAQKPAGTEPARADRAHDAGATADAGKPADAADEDAAAAPSDADASAAPAAKTPTPDVALPPTVQDRPVKAGIIFYSAKGKPAEMAAFHQKDLEAKGWKLGRNDSAPVPGSTLTGVVQEYTKGPDVLTVALTEQAGSDDTVTFVYVMDFPVPPKSRVIAGYPFAIVESDESPDATGAWFRKELTARGWTGGGQKEAGIAKSVVYKKGGRTLQPIVLPVGGGRTGSRIQLMHMAAAG